MLSMRALILTAAGVAAWLTLASRLSAVDELPQLLWPTVGGEINLDFGEEWVLNGCDRQPMKHAGIDIAVASGTPVFATEDGIVRHAEGAQRVQGGQWIVISHIHQGSEYTSSYWHVVPSVRPGQAVTRGQQIATVDGVPDNEHFHFALRDARYGPIAHNLALPATRNCTPLLPKFPEHFLPPTLFVQPPNPRMLR